jgi:hypothetical protein
MEDRQMPQVEVWIGEVRISEASADPALNPGAVGSTRFADAAAETLSGVGPCIASLFSKMNISDAVMSDKVGAKEFELELGFSLEIGAGGGLQLFLSPKAGVTCRAKAKWTL